MGEIVLGVLVMIGIFVFWFDVTNSWNNVFHWVPRISSPLFKVAHYQNKIGNLVRIKIQATSHDRQFGQHPQTHNLTTPRIP
jgi:hypothetical protein